MEFIVTQQSEKVTDNNAIDNETIFQNKKKSKTMFYFHRHKKKEIKKLHFIMKEKQRKEL